MDTRADEFVSQSREHLTILEQILLSLEKPDETVDVRDRIDGCFRLVHSIKGDAGFLGYGAIRTLANAMETLFESMRAQELPISTLAIERLLHARDRLASLVDDLGNRGDADLREILVQLESLAGARGSTVQSWDIDLRSLDDRRQDRLIEFFAEFERLGAVLHPRIVLAEHDFPRERPGGSVRFQAQLDSSLTADEIRTRLGLAPGTSINHEPGLVPLSIELGEWTRVSERPLAILLGDLDRLGSFERPTLDLECSDLMSKLGTGPIVLHGQLRTTLSRQEVEDRLELPNVASANADQPRASITGPSALSVPSELAPAVHPKSRQSGLTAAGSTTRSTTADEDRTATLRINVELLDRLMTLIGELTLIRNQSLLACEHDEGPLRSLVQRLSAVTSSLQETVLRTRMQPVGNLFGKFPRVVRDLGRQLGKQVEITIVGRDVELDKTILEQLADPLTHLVRNSVDHGIEMPDQRVAAGKGPIGQISLIASHEDGQVRIEIRDDGRGIDPQAVRAKALALRLKTESDLDRMSTRELFALILLPGFSTARQVTEVSGRGVGMDVVKTNIELLEGSLTIDSQPGVGTAMIIRMPLTLAIIPCLIVGVRCDRYAIPQREIEEAICLHPGLKGRIEQAFDTEFYRLRERLLPIIRLREVFDRPRPFTAQTKAEILNTYAQSNPAPTHSEYIVVVRQERKRFGLLVDNVHGTEEIVVKPMNVALKRVEIFSGATIMGDGRVALIANVSAIVQHARVSFETELAKAPKISQTLTEAHRFLLFEYGPSEQFAMPLVQIRRIESFDPGRIEKIGNLEYVSINGVATRILRLDRVMTVSACAPGKSSHLVLLKFSREPTGVLISRIVDSASLAVELQRAPEDEHGILGTAIVRGRLTLFLDSHYLAERSSGATAPLQNPSGRRKRRARILLIDDTPFFRDAVGRYLSDAGFDVAAAVHGQDGIDKLSTAEFDLVVSDIEMPVMDGWTFAQHARKCGYRGPLLALSSLSRPENEARARACGFDEFEEKLDHDRLIRTVERMLNEKVRG